jgi:hypothetical protein
LDESAQAHETTADILYLDGACTQRVRVFPKDLTDVPKLVVGEPTVDSCRGTASDYPVFEIGDETYPITPLYYSHDGQCTTLADPTNLRVFTLGNEVAPNKFVAAERTIEADSGARLGAITLVAEDGAREVVGIEDMKKQAECIVGPYGVAEGPCIPTKIAWGIGDFSDDACSEPTAYVSAVAPTGSEPPCAEPEIVVSVTLGPSCNGPDASFYAVGSRVDAGYRSVDGACTAQPGYSGHVSFSFGSKLSESSFGHIGTARVGSGRLKADYDAAGTRVLKGRGGFYDTTTGSGCFETDYCDGMTRCVTFSRSSERLYADDTCATLVVKVLDSACGEPLDTGPVKIAPDTGSAKCSTDEGDVVQIGAETATPVSLFQKKDGSCVPSDTPVGSGGTWHELGKVVDPSTFPEIVKRTE